MIYTKRLAEQFLSKTGLVCIDAKSARTAAKLTIRPMGERTGMADEPTLRWFKSARDAEAVLNELVSGRHDIAKRTKTGFKVKATPDLAILMVEAAAVHRNIEIIPASEIRAKLGRVKQRVHAAVAEMQAHGTLKGLHEQYRTERLRPRREGEPDMPPYQAWLSKQLEERLAATESELLA
jgi:hypothetical protein